MLNTRVSPSLLEHRSVRGRLAKIASLLGQGVLKLWVFLLFALGVGFSSPSRAVMCPGGMGLVQKHDLQSPVPARPGERGLLQRSV